MLVNATVIISTEISKEPNLIPENIREGIEIFRIIGTMAEGAQVITGLVNISEGKTANIPEIKNKNNIILMAVHTYEVSNAVQNIGSNIALFGVLAEGQNLVYTGKWGNHANQPLCLNMLSKNGANLILTDELSYTGYSITWSSTNPYRYFAW